MAKTSPAEFIREVRQEAQKVTWPSRKETTITTMIVFGFVTVAAVFFLLVDTIMSTLIQLVLGLGG
jgi:preprotein translocase subunit SecE